MRRTLILLAFMLMALPAAAQFSVLSLKNSMVQFLLDQLSTEGVFEITAEEVLEPEDGVTAITGLAIADAEGIWFTAESLDFAWSASRLLSGEVEFTNLAMRGVRITRQPQSEVAVEVEPEEEPDEAPGTLTIDWPRAPLALRIERMALEGVVIEEPVMGHAISFDAEGAARDEGDVQAASLRLTRTDQVEGQINFDYELRFDTNTFRLTLEADEAPGGLITDLGG
ncbi:MAG: hypothetical protein AAGI70_02625, partial [Pseudomonadota bacterium]